MYMTNTCLYFIFVTQELTLYPVNKMRNMAMDNAAPSEFVFPIDADFVPNPGLQDQLETYIETGFFNSTVSKFDFSKYM